MSVPGWVWAAWVATFGVLFAVFEGLALRNKIKGDTLSENIRRWLGIDPARPGRRVGMALFAGTLVAFTAWFVPHVLWEWPN